MARDLSRALSVCDQVIKLVPLTSYDFVALEGGEYTQELGQYGEGDKSMHYSIGVSSVEEITIRGAFKNPLSIRLLEELNTYMKSPNFLTVNQYVAVKSGQDYLPGELIKSFTQCTLVGIAGPTYDEIGSDTAMVEVRLRPTYVTFGRGRSRDGLTDVSDSIQLQDQILGSFDSIDFSDFGISSASFNF